MAENGCLICGADLVYLDEAEEMECSICGKTLMSNAKCENGHFICDACHAADGFTIINRYCTNSKTINPVLLATTIMKHPKIKMHGPEHHFLVPAVLISAYYNKIGSPNLIPEKLEKAKERSMKIPGGFCGFCGNCGAGVGTGIFISVVLNSTPVAQNEWRLSNLITAKSLLDIANNGGPRCCKRDTYLSLETAICFVKEELDVELDSSVIQCEFYTYNKECRKKECLYYPK